MDLSPAAHSSSPEISLAVLRDFAEEQWPSMELVADMLIEQLHQAPGVRVNVVKPRYRIRARRIPLLRRSALAVNADRLLNRMLDYPRYAKALGSSCDAYHVVDHSYSQVVPHLPSGRAGVYCHDLDTFRSILAPQIERRSLLFRKMARRILNGFQAAAVVFHSTDAVRSQILNLGLIDASRLVKAPYGFAPEFTPDDPPESCPPEGLPERFILHVGSCITRKRIDVLLSTFEQLSLADPDLHLVQIGGEWDAGHRASLRRLRSERVHQFRGIDRVVLASIYRRAAVVLQPSEAEGFGLPVIEALACGAAVIGSDIPPLREVGGDAVLFCPVGEVDRWVACVGGVLAGTLAPPDRSQRLAQAAKFSWKSHAETILSAYRRICGVP